MKRRIQHTGVGRGWAGEERISETDGKMESTHPEGHSPSGFPPLPTSETQRGSG